MESLKLTGGLISPTVNDQCYCIHSRSPRSEGGLGLTGSPLHYMCMADLLSDTTHWWFNCVCVCVSLCVRRHVAILLGADEWLIMRDKIGKIGLCLGCYGLLFPRSWCRWWFRAASWFLHQTLFRPPVAILSYVELGNKMPYQPNHSHSNYSWSNSLELVKIQPKKFTNVA